MSEREVGAQVHAALELADRLPQSTAQPQSTPQGPVPGWVSFVGGHAGCRCLKREIHLPVTVRSEVQKYILKMREREPSVGSREARVELERASKKMLGLAVVGALELVHVPEPPV